MIKCLLSSPGLIAGPLHSTPLQIISQSIPRLDPINSKSSLYFNKSMKIVFIKLNGFSFMRTFQGLKTF